MTTIKLWADGTTLIYDLPALAGWERVTDSRGVPCVGR